jgi:hypothetical protein
MHLYVRLARVQIQAAGSIRTLSIKKCQLGRTECLFIILSENINYWLERLTAHANVSTYEYMHGFNPAILRTQLSLNLRSGRWSWSANIKQTAKLPLKYWKGSIKLAKPALKYWKALVGQTGFKILRKLFFSRTGCNIFEKVWVDAKENAFFPVNIHSKTKWTEDGGTITALTNKDQTSTQLKVKCKSSTNHS